MTTKICAACGATLPENATQCSRCNVVLVRPADQKKLSYEILLYVLISVVVTLALLFILEARKMFFVAVFLQLVMPIIVLLVLAFFTIRLWKR